MFGHSTYGGDKEKYGDNEPLAANQVIVFMGIGVNERITLPIAYHFITSLTAKQKRDLMTDVVNALIDVGVRVTSISFDGLKTNKTMCQLLGANFNIFSMNQFKPYFEAKNGDKIRIIFDVCHMEKLIRNHLGKQLVFYDELNNKIEWKFYEELLKCDKKGYALTHKLTQNHIKFQQRKMKVILAVQLFSASTADSIEFLMKDGQKEFRDATSTIEFTRMFNDLFDILNSKADHHKNRLKKAICLDTKEEIFGRFEQAIKYIKQLKYKGEAGEVKTIVNSALRTGFVGMIINMYSVMSLYTEYVEEKKLLKSIPTYSLSQDPLEIFFGKTRSLNGYNDNPSCQQFQSAYRKLLVHSTVCTSKSANCYNFDVAAEP